MNILIIVLIVVLALVALPFVIALFMKKDYTVERSIDIDQPKDKVFEYIKYVRNTENFSKWVMADPNAKREYSGTDGEVGFIFKWDSPIKDVGAGEQEITGVYEGEKVTWEIRFIRPFSGKSIAYMETTALGENKTRVRWVFNGIMKYPMNFVMLFLDFDKFLGKDQEISLQNLKKCFGKRQ